MTTRLLRRLWRHHLPFGLVSGGAAFILYVTRPYPDVLTRLSFATAWPALVLLTTTMLIGPWRTLTRKQPVFSLDLRRDIGIWAGIIGVLHAVIGQCVHLRGRPWLYYIYENWQRDQWAPLRHDMFGFSNFSGLFAALVLAVLLATSNDAALRKLGTARWKSWQRWNYACFGLSAAHTFGYLLGIESLKWPAIIIAALCVAATAGLQFAGWRRHA
jgi:sulfoxide reductase heme-binding subunit YedZ